MERQKVLFPNSITSAIIFVCSLTHGSVIKFEAFPNKIKTNLTNSASMRCSLADNPQTNSQIGRRLSMNDDPAASVQIRRRSATSSSDDILHISSIFITNSAGDDVASVSPFDAPIAYVDPGNLQAKGDVTGTSSEGYLEITWKDPSAIDIGEYSCIVNTVDHHHHPTMFESSLVIKEITPTINDVIAALKDMNQAQEVKINRLEQQQETLKQCVAKRIGFTAAISKDFHLNTGEPAVFDKVIYSHGGGYDSATGKFTAPEPGVYSFRLHALSSHKNDVVLNIVVNGAIITSCYAYGPSISNSYGTVKTAAAGALIHLKTNDVVQVIADNYPDGSSYDSDFYQNPSIFNGNVFIGHLEQSDCVL